MYKGNFNGPRKSGGSGFGNRSHGSGGFRGGRSGGFRGGRGGGGGNRGKTETINFARFINKVQMIEEVEVFKPEHNFQDFKILDVLKEIRDLIKYKNTVTYIPNEWPKTETISKGIRRDRGAGARRNVSKGVEKTS